jgi:hypothetical protein
MYMLEVHFTGVASRATENTVQQSLYICSHCSASVERTSKAETYVKSQSIRSSRARNKAQNINGKLTPACRVGSYQNGKTALSYFLVRMRSKF